MGILVKKGSIGSVSGTVGNVVVSKWRGKDVVRKPKTKRSKKKKKPEQEQNIRLSTVTHFLSRFKDEIRIGFEKKIRKDPAFQTAVKRNLKDAVLGEHPPFRMNYKKVIFSDGELDMAWGAKIELTSTLDVHVVWEVPETSRIKITGQDVVCLVLYNENKHRVLNLSDKGWKRSDFEITTPLGNLYHGHTFHAWIFFVSPDGKSVSNTRYIGSVQVPEKVSDDPSAQQDLPA